MNQSLPTIIKRDDHCVSRKNITSATLKVLYRLHEKGYNAYLAGGAVRDLMLKRKPKDFDVVTDATPEDIKNIFRNSRIVGRRFRLAHILFRGEIIETSTFRASLSNENIDEEEPTIIKDEEGLVVRDNHFGSPEEDALRRDFTVNALFYDLKNFTVIDYANGLFDLNNKIIKVIGDPDKRFVEDPVRMIRAIRFASTLGFSIDKNDFESIKKNAHLLHLASPTRMYDEMQKLFFCGNSKTMFSLLEEASIIEYMFKEFYNWLNDDSKRKEWVLKCLDQLDRWKRANLKINPALLLALIFGEYHKILINEKKGSKNKVNHPIKDVIYEHLTSISQNIRIPKTIIYQVCDIMFDQSRFLKINKHKSNRFLNSPRFIDAFLFFKLWSKFHNINLNELDFWSKKQRSV